MFCPIFIVCDSLCDGSLADDNGKGDDCGPRHVEGVSDPNVFCSLLANEQPDDANCSTDHPEDPGVFVDNRVAISGHVSFDLVEQGHGEEHVEDVLVHESHFISVTAFEPVLTSQKHEGNGHNKY